MSTENFSASYCQACVFQTHPVMLSTYCLRSHPCDRCGRRADCALVIRPRSADSAPLPVAFSPTGESVLGGTP